MTLFNTNRHVNTWCELIQLVELNETNKKLLWIPEGFGHGFLTLSHYADVQYKVTKKWARESEKSILWDDSDLKIDWPLNKLDLDQPLISEKDSAGLTIKQAEKLNFVFSYEKYPKIDSKINA